MTPIQIRGSAMYPGMLHCLVYISVGVLEGLIFESFHWTDRHTLVQIPISIHQGSAELDTVKMKGVGVARKFILPTPRSNNLTARQNEDYCSEGYIILTERR